MEYSSFRSESSRAVGEGQVQDAEYVPFSRLEVPASPVMTEPCPQPVCAPSVLTSNDPVTAQPQAGGPVILRPAIGASDARKASLLKSVLLPVIGYVIALFAVAIIGAFNSEGSSAYEAALNVLTALLLVSPIYLVVIVVRYLRLRKK